MAVRAGWESNIGQTDWQTALQESKRRENIAIGGVRLCIQAPVESVALSLSLMAVLLFA
jgi:hypothetical protein